MKNESPYYQLANDFALFTNRSIFLTGKAGTGKTTFLHKLKQATKKQMAVVAPTGVAAINAGGTTIHSFFQLPFTPFIPTNEGRKNLVEKIKMQGNRRKVLQELELLVIDEISMVRADILDSIDTVLRHVRYRNNEPFGGVQVIFIGDMFQLPPVVSDDEWHLLNQYYNGPYFFHSQVIGQRQPVYIELDKIFRQTNADFIRVLNEVRNNCLSESGLKLLQSRYNPLFVPPADDTFITLTTHNYKADQINAEELAKIKGKTYTFNAKIEGEYPEKSYPTEQKLELKIGAKVMFLRNDTETPRRFFNGKIGMIESIEEDVIEIKCPGEPGVVELQRAVWENIRYTVNPATKQIEEKELGKFIQFPLRLAWAITIHKSQGLTFDKAVIDAGNAFATGQVYVALSRCRSLEGMVLLSKINPESIQNDRQIVSHEQNKLPMEELELQLDESRNQYRNFILSQLFDFKNVVGLVKSLERETAENESSFNAETFTFLKELGKLSVNLQDIALKFQGQIQSILQSTPVHEDYLQERLTAACEFFVEKGSVMLETLRQSPAVTDSRTHAATYTDALKMVFSNLAQKVFIFNGMKFKFTVEDYFILKNTFILPEFNVSAYAKTSQQKQQSTLRPDLYRKLQQLRNELCEPRDLPIYLVAGSQTLSEMADFLPQSEKDLLQISGFGPAKVGKYGQPFLEIIRSYCKENNLDSQMDKKEKPKEKKGKKPVGETMRISLAMYCEGKSIEEIATSRNLNVSTIIGHLERYVITGELDINNFIAEDKRKEAARMVRESSETGSVFEMLSTFLNYVETKMFLAWLRSGKN
ncbi:MAG TPA: helix-turn-helix domain-containing protein [Paludibacter sp.]|nr:helix-turn-helix domain-containing protein [Paludibacter sp.]